MWKLKKKTKKKKFRKNLKHTIYILGFSVAPVIFVSSNVQQATNEFNDKTSYLENKIFDNNLKKYNMKKVVKKKYSPVISLSLDDNNKIIHTQKDIYEIKIFLNYQTFYNNSDNDIRKDVEQYSKGNQYLLEVILPNLKDVASYDYSRLTPIAWVRFNNQDSKTENLEYLSKENFVHTIFSYEEKKHVEPQASFPISMYSDCLWGCGSTSWYPSNHLEKFSANNLTSHFNIINFTAQRERENKRVNSYNYLSIKGSIGILEAESGVVNPKLDYFKNKSIEIYNHYWQQKNQHANLVAAIAAGRSGVDRFAKIYSAGFYYRGYFGSWWQLKLEWMIIDKNVRVINHSYGSNRNYNKVEYGEDSYLLDFWARKYGVVNVFAAGNGQNDIDNENEWIDGTQLSFNSITVGSIIDGKTNFKPSKFSNRTRFGKYIDLPKPLISAPGEEILLPGITKKDTFKKGTSYAAPFVSGAISTLLREKKLYFNDKNRPHSIKAILVASAQKSNSYFFENEKRSNGLNNSVGAGLIDFEKMLEATNNLKTKTVYDSDNGIVFDYGIINLKKGEKVQIASSWLFNAGILKNKEKKPKRDNLPLSIFGYPTDISFDLWAKQHINENWLNKETAFSRQGKKMFTDYDLYLEKKADNEQWVKIKNVSVVNSNVELIRYTATSSGEYRILVRKYKDSVFSNSVPDKLAVTYAKV